MTDDRDPHLQALFADGQKVLGAEAFSGQVMRQVARLQFRTMAKRIGLALALICFAILMSAPLNDAILLFTQTLNTPVISLNNSMPSQLVSSLNSVASLLGLVFLGLFLAFRRLFL